MVSRWQEGLIPGWDGMAAEYASKSQNLLEELVGYHHKRKPSGGYFLTVMVHHVIYHTWTTQGILCLSESNRKHMVLICPIGDANFDDVGEVVSRNFFALGYL